MARTSSAVYLLSVGAIESPKVRALGANGKILIGFLLVDANHLSGIICGAAV